MLAALSAQRRSRSMVGGRARKPKYQRIERVARPGDKRRRIRCRCSKCERRATFIGYPWMKRRVPRCECDAQAWRVDWYRMLIETTRNRCDCGALYFPHRRDYCKKILGEVYTCASMAQVAPECTFE